MSRARHAKRAAGGKVVAYSGGASNVMKEAHERKRGGRVHAEGEGEEAKTHAGKRARGGRVKGRARGGATGSDKRPLSSAAKTTHLPEEKGGATGAGPANETSTEND